MANYSEFQDPQVNYPKADIDLAFSDYILQCENIIRNNRLDLHTYKDPEAIIKANSPYELKPSVATPKYGVLLIHGLLATPFVMKDIGLALQQQNLLVRSILLPGHGVSPGALLNVTYEDWLETVRYGITSLAKEVDKIFLVGYSTGASLALYHCLQEKTPSIAGVIQIAPAIKIYSSFAFLTKYLYWLGKILPRANWLSQMEENDYVKYQSITCNAGYQVNRLAQAIHKISKTTTFPYPLFTILSEDDRTVSSQAALKYLHKYAPAKSQLLIYTNSNQTTATKDSLLRPANFPELNIANISHIALPIAPDNFHYGKNGDYIFASRIEENLNKQADNKVIYGTLNDFQNQIHQLLYKLGLHSKPQQLLSFNPDFEFMQEAINQFIKKVI
jgi:esterase/lipase